MSKITYLSIPYTFNPEKSFEIANIVAARLMSKGYIIFSPISHSHPIADYLDTELRTSQEFWMKQDIPLVSKCDEMIIVVIGDNGYSLIENSKGCQSEIKEAKRLEMPIKLYIYEE